ncbi:MAG: hypothetical protein ACT6U0_02505 [Shinella sp.]|uniref:hypothetical protein n=1 Tax=Shinella sp. TaxID=1870904 RepID=UPI004035837E
MNSIVFVLETRSHMPRLFDEVDIGVPEGKVTIVHGAECRKMNSKSAMPALHGALLRKCTCRQRQIGAELR